jgi:hypothetical protein
MLGKVAAVIAAGLALAGCSATLSSLSFMKSTPPTEALRIESDPPGAEARTTLGQSCRTPCELTVDPTSELSVTLTLAGYQPQTVSVRPDAAGDAGPRLAPNPVFVELPPQPAATAGKKAPRKKKPTATTARAAPGTSSVAPPPMPSTPTEPAASATNYPWPSR